MNIKLRFDAAIAASLASLSTQANARPIVHLLPERTVIQHKAGLSVGGAHDQATVIRDLWPTFGPGPVIKAASPTIRSQWVTVRITSPLAAHPGTHRLCK